MNDSDRQILIMLFNEVSENCFGFKVPVPVPDADCKYMSEKINEKTGLGIQPQKIRDYSVFVSRPVDSGAEIPSVETLDTLARYVLDAPVIDEATRREKEADYPYWFWYRKKRTERMNRPKVFFKSLSKSGFPYLLGLIVIIAFVVFEMFLRKEKFVSYTDQFNSVREDSLYMNGWLVRSADTLWWSRRDQMPGHLTLFTLRGDNWPLGLNSPDIQNMLSRRIANNCFDAEIHLSNFLPLANWQQAGILVSEDLSFSGRMIRMSLAYNDGSGNDSKQPEIFVQVTCSSPRGPRSKPDEILHQTLFNSDSISTGLAIKSLKSLAMRIEKDGSHLSFFISNGSGDNIVFRKVVEKDFDFKPKYISIFSMSGWSDSAKIIPASFDSFSITGHECR